jgi:Mn-containing catalase
VYASGNVAADMLANATAESTGRMLAVQLWKMTDDPGMKDMLSYMIARDTMHQNQWLAAWEELGGPENHPIPNSFPQENENSDYAYAFMSFGVGDDFETPRGEWTKGKSFDGKGSNSVVRMRPLGDKPQLGAASPKTAAQKGQMKK